MPKRERRPTPPGKILQEFYLQPRGLSVSRFARAADLTRKHVSNTVNGPASITSETAVRFAEV
jgi:addiction module HigA family antidote